MKKIFITGGHLTPAQAVIDVLLKKNWYIFYLGRKHALEGDTALSQEWLTLKNSQVNFLPLSMGRLQRTFTYFTIYSWFKIPLGFITALYYLIRYRPQIILAFGGYMAVPVVLGAWILNIPVITHEQTLQPGLANRLISRFAHKICIAWESTKKYFPEGKVVITGNPVRREIFSISDTFPFASDKPVIYITGGNLGAHAINLIIEESLENLLSNFEIIHQTGNSSSYNDFSRMVNRKNLLPSILKKRYHIFEYIPGSLIGFVFKYAEIIVTRAGANIVSEIIAAKKLALLIPLPWSGRGEQEANAQFLRDHHAAEVIYQSELTARSLIVKIDTLLINKNETLEKLNTLGKYFSPGAQDKIVSVIESVV